MIGTHTIEASDCVVLNTLHQHAHHSGRMTDRAQCEIPLGNWSSRAAGSRAAIHGVAVNWWKNEFRAALQEIKEAKIRPDETAEAERGGEAEARVIEALSAWGDVSRDERATRHTYTSFGER